MYRSRDQNNPGEFSAGDIKIKTLISNAQTDGTLKAYFLHHRHIPIKWAVPDEADSEMRIAFYLDGVEAHKNRTVEDDEMRDLLARQRWIVAEAKYSGSLSDQRAKEIFERLMSFVEERLSQPQSAWKGRRVEV